MIFESLQLKVDFESLLSANEAVSLLIFLSVFTLLTQLRKLVNNSPWKNLEDNFFHK